MTTVYAIHGTDPSRLAAVKADMQSLGSPTIRVVNCADYYMALEGSHRLAAAAALGLTPAFVVFEQDDEIDITGFDWYDAANWAATTYPAGEVAGELYSQQVEPYRFAT